MKKQHVPAPGKASGLAGTALCGLWASYQTGDHDQIRRLAWDAKKKRQGDHYCAACLRKL